MRAVGCADHNQVKGQKKTGLGFVHAQSPRTSRVAQSLDGDRLMGSLHFPTTILVRVQRKRNSNDCKA
jgi:hypothetical protein